MRMTPREDQDWLPKALEAVRHVGHVVIEGVVPQDQLDETRDRMYRVQSAIREEIGQDRLARAGELGVLRNMAHYDEFFLGLLILPELLAVVDGTVGDTAILHLQNGFILPSTGADAPATFQHSFHRDFPRDLNGYVASINVMLTVDRYTAANGGTLIVPGTHQRADPPDEGFLRSAAVPVECEAGSLVCFDSTLWHAAGPNRSGEDRLAINHQFTRSWIKQQIDYVRALGNDVIERQEPRVQQLLGWYTRVVTSLDDYYQPPERRLYRGGQG